MKTELERYKKALHVAMLAYRGAAQWHIDATDKEIEDILNPPVEMEEVEIERFVIFYSDGSTSHMLTREGLQGFDCTGGTAKRIAHTLTRPKPVPVERSVSINGMVTNNGDFEVARPFDFDNTCHGKTGVLTFTWTE